MSTLTNIGFELAKMVGAGLAGMGLAVFLTRLTVAQLTAGKTPRATPTRATGVGLTLLAVLSLGTLTSAERDQSQRASCQIQFNAAFARAVTASREAADQERTADDEDRNAEDRERDAFAVLVRALQEGGGLGALRTYEAVLSSAENDRAATAERRQEARDKRAASPLPAVPDCDGRR